MSLAEEESPGRCLRSRRVGPLRVRLELHREPPPTPAVTENIRPSEGSWLVPEPFWTLPYPPTPPPGTLSSPRFRRSGLC